MADQEENAKVTGASDIQAAVENAKAADETTEDEELDTGAEDSDDDSADDKEDTEDSDEEEKSKKDDKSPDDESDDDEEDSEEDKKKSEKETESTERKFKQFAADEDVKYISNLEKGYEASSAEALNLKKDLDSATTRNDAIMQVIARDPKLAESFQKALAGGDTEKGESKEESNPTSDPFLVDAQTKWRETSQKEAQEFIEANPESVNDPKIKAQVQRLVAMFSKDVYDNEGRLLSSGEALEKAYASMGLENKLKTDTKAQVANRAKESAAPTRRGSSKKKTKKDSSSGFTDAQHEMAEKMGYSSEKLSKFANNN